MIWISADSHQNLLTELANLSIMRHALNDWYQLWDFFFRQNLFLDDAGLQEFGKELKLDLWQLCGSVLEEDSELAVPFTDWDDSFAHQQNGKFNIIENSDIQLQIDICDELGAQVLCCISGDYQAEHLYDNLNCLWVSTVVVFARCLQISLDISPQLLSFFVSWRGLVHLWDFADQMAFICICEALLVNQYQNRRQGLGLLGLHERWLRRRSKSRSTNFSLATRVSLARYIWILAWLSCWFGISLWLTKSLEILVNLELRLS